MKNQKTTLRDLISIQKSRVGQADGYTEKGAYWIAFEMCIAQRGGGKFPVRALQSLQIRHHRSGDVESVVECLQFSQDSDREKRTCFPVEISEAVSVEEVLVGLLNLALNKDDYLLRPVIDDELESAFIKALRKIGLALAPAASPDDDDADSAITALGELSV